MRRLVLPLVLLLGCGSSNHAAKTDAPGGGGDGPGSSQMDGPPGGRDSGNGGFTRTIFVIPMENEPSSAIYGNTTNAPYINSLLAQAAHTTNFQDELPNDPSEPHYVFMEGGTASFTDHTFSNDNDPSSTNSTSSTKHLVDQLEAAGVTWTSYQEGMAQGTCPVKSSGFYAAKHDPMVFYQDVAGSPPSSSSSRCKAHHAPYSSFAADLAAGQMANYVFITPNLCHDMHGASSCPQGTNVNMNIQAGDTWLQSELPRILAYAQAHDGLVFITWDEGDSSNLIPFLALGPRIATGKASSVMVTHGSVIKTIDETFGISPLATVASGNDLSDLYQSGMFP